MNRLNQHTLTRRRWLLALTTILSGSAVHAAVLPRGASVVGGLASIVANGPGLTVNQTSQRAIIDWNSFSVGPGAWVHFVQPGATSAILNRVTGGNPSQIYGAIQANGQVFVINPNGVVVGPTGVIQAGAFVASTLNVTDPAFMSGGPIAFVGGSAAAVQNFGFITAADGDTVLIGRKVDNAGTLQASQGAVALAAGSEILLQPSSDQRLVVQAGLPTGGTGADNTGAIKAAQAELIAAGGNAYALAVNAAGTIQAVGVAHVNGRVVLTAAGGDVQVSGSVSAQNADGSGGQIEVGGGSRGQDPGVVDAANATITASGRLDASASGPVGDGGQITVWSNGKTVFAGQIDAKGGASAGQGGAVEVSGGWESITGKVDTLAPHGATGSLLLDPDSAIIDTNPTTLAGGVSGIVSGATTTYSASAIEALLAGTDVTIQTNAAISGGTGDITLEDTSGRNTAFALSNFTGNLLIEAANNLDIKVPVSVSATTPASTPYNQTTGTVTFQAGQTITVSAPLTLNAIAVGVNGGSSAATTLGAVSFLATQGAINFTATAPITLTAVAQGGAATLTGSGISVNANAGGDANVTLNGLTLQAGDGLMIAAPVQMSLIAQGGGSASGYHTNAVNGGAASIAPGLFSFAAGAGALTLTAPVTVSESATGGAGADVSNDGYANVGPGGAARIGPWPASAPWSSSSIPWSPGLAFSGASIDLGSGVVGPAGSVTASAIANGGTGGASGYDDTLSTVAGGPGGAATVYAPGINFDSLGAFSLGATDLLKSGVTANSGAYGSAYNGTQAPGGAASAVAGDIDITAASAALAGTVRLTAAASDAGGVDATGIVNVGALKLTANAGAVTLDGSISSSATMDGALIGDVPSPFGDFIFSGGDLAVTAAGDILSNISQSLAAFAGVAPSAGAASLSGLAAITLAAGDSVLMPGATFALPLQTDPGRTGLVIAADTAGTAGQVGGVTGALDLYGATLPPILSLTTPNGPNVSIWGVDGALMNLGEAYAATPGAAYFGNAHYLPGDVAAGVHCQSVSCGAPVLTITANNVEATYGAAIPAFTAAYSGLAYGDGGAGSANDNITAPQFSTRYVLTGSQITPNVGTYAITPVPGAAPGYYSRVNAVAGSLTIIAAPLTIAADNAVMTYGGAAPVLGDAITGLVNGDTASALGTLVLANLQAASSNAGTYTGAITVSGAADSNYAITYAPGSLTINPAPLLITAANAVMTYGGALPAFATTFGTVVGGVIEDGLVNGDTPASIASLTVATTAGTHPNAGTYVLTPSGGRDPNYTISYAPGALTVDPAPLTLGASAIEDFGRGSPTYTATYSGLVNGDAASVLGPLTYSSSVPLTSPVGSYPGAIVAAGARDPNYAITYVAGPLTINPFGTLTVTANSFTIDYGAALPNFTASYAGLKPGDTSAVVTGLKFSTTATLGANVGTYQIRPYGASAPSYYTLVYADGVLTIAPAPVTVTAANASIVYGAAAMPLLGVSVSGLVDNDAAAQVVSAAPTTTARLGSNAGTYAIAPNATLLNPNY
ncbi:MAG: filamentous hemagglutinin N-terminal domain-containing protein, partial [Alphaproteobacteria bacterium]|nr:filamentous hemagglutinin N-terminal domain-containing protein [Alphaproteobacteria bacterium]